MVVLPGTDNLSSRPVTGHAEYGERDRRREREIEREREKERERERNRNLKCTSVNMYSFFLVTIKYMQIKHSLL